MFASAIGWLSHHAALVVLVNLSLGFAGVPALTEGVLLTAGAAAAKGGGLPWLVMPAAVLGSAIGMTMCFEIGRRGHDWLVVHLAGWIPSSRQAARARYWCRRFGPWSIVLSFFTPGLRHVTALALGATRLGRQRFVTFAVGGACAWASTLIIGGYMAGDAAGRVSSSSRSLLNTTVSRALRDRSHFFAPPRTTHELRRLRGDTQLPDFVTI
jgi:membrane protein DedA with SNARE-associated domain